MPKHSTKSGVGLTEYGLIIACVLCLCIVSLQNLGSQINGNFGLISLGVAKINDGLNPKKIGAMPPGKIPDLNGLKSGIDVNPYPAPIVGGTSQSAETSNGNGGNNGSFTDNNGNVHRYLPPGLSENVGDNTVSLTGATPATMKASQK